MDGKFFFEIAAFYCTLFRQSFRLGGSKKVMSSEDISPGSLKAKDREREPCAMLDKIPKREIASDQQGYNSFWVRGGFGSFLHARASPFTKCFHRMGLFFKN